MCGYRGYGFGLIEYLKTKGNFLGGEGNVNLFEIKDNKLYYNNKNINTQLYSHLFFIYKCDELDIKSARDKKLIKKFNKMKQIESWFIKNTDIIIINKISNSKYDTYRNDFFDKLKEIVNVPEYKLIKNEKDMNTFFAMMGNDSYILRTESDCSSYNCFLVNKNTIFESYYYLKKKTNSTLIVMNFYHPYVKELDCNITARIFMKRDYIDIISADPFRKELFSHRQKEKKFNYIDIDSHSNRLCTSNLEHIKNIKKENFVEFHSKCYVFLFNYIKKYKKKFVDMQKHIGLDIISVDFLPLNDGPIFLEIGIKNGLSKHKVEPIIKTTNNNISKIFDNYLNNHNERNEQIYKNIFKKYNLYCDIDNTICNSIPRIKRNFLKNIDKLDEKWKSYDEMITDDILDNSVFYLNKLRHKYNIIFITARKNIDNHDKITKEWLSNKGFKYENIIYTNSLLDKIQYLDNSDLFIDDCSKGHQFVNSYLQKDIISKIKEKGIILEIYNSENNNWSKIYNTYKN